MKTTSNHAQAAKEIRKELKQNFPTINFSVTSQRYSGGSSVHVSWENGPTSAMVNAIISKYQYGSFDAMEDMYRVTNSRKDLPQVQYVHSYRRITDDIKKKALNSNFHVVDEIGGYLSADQQAYRLLKDMDLTNGFQD